MIRPAPSVFSEIDNLAEVQTRSHGLSLPATIIESLEENGVQSVELHRIVGPKEEIFRLVESKQDLTPVLAERVSRLAHIISVAETVFGKREKAFLWLRTINPDLGSRRPIELLESESGARIVEEALMRIAYGVFA